MKLLVTGGAGFIGSNFVHHWRDKYPDDKIVVLDKLTYAGDKANLHPHHDAIEFIEGDITDEEIVRKVMEGCDVVVHFAAESHVDRSIHDPYVFSRSNVLGTHVLLETARQLGIKKFHHISTDEVFGHIPLDEDWKFNESTAYRPNSPYSASKAASDHMVRAYHKTYGLPITISNCSNNFGPRMYPEKFIPRSIVRLLNGQNIRLYTPGNQIRDWVHVNDHCHAIDLILHKGQTGKTYTIGGMTEGISNIEVAKLILKLMNLPESRIEFVTDRPAHDQKYDVDWTNINRELGWAPQYGFEEWLRQTIDWYIANEKWWKPLAQESEALYSTREKIVTNPKTL